jgi:hypothetical protein
MPLLSSTNVYLNIPTVKVLSVSSTDDTSDKLLFRKTEQERRLPDERGVEGAGEEPKHTTARKACPLYINQYSPECVIEKLPGDPS